MGHVARTEGLRILGVDPGTRVTGYGVIEHAAAVSRHVCHGQVRTKSSDPLWIRLKHIHEAISQVVQEHHPDAMVIERCFVSKNVSSALKLGHARGVIIIAGLSAGAAIHEYSPTEIKNAVVGHGRADKTQVAEMIRMILRLKESPPHDAADALAAALCHAQGTGMRRQMMRAKRGRR